MEKFGPNKLIPISELSSELCENRPGWAEKLKHAKSHIKDNDHEGKLDNFSSLPPPPTFVFKFRFPCSFLVPKLLPISASTCEWTRPEEEGKKVDAALAYSLFSLLGRFMHDLEKCQ